MREILFRGKTESGEWVYGGFCYGNNRNESIICPRNDFSKEVIPETIGQYTGLRDSKRSEIYLEGQPIYEGDIVCLTDEQYKTEWKAVVVFGNPYCTYNWGWNLQYIGEKPECNTDILLWVEMEEVFTYCEVIGNIHDNPELLKGEYDA